MAHLQSSRLFSVDGLVAVVTGGGTGKYQSKTPPEINYFIYNAYIFAWF